MSSSVTTTATTDTIPRPTASNVAYADLGGGQVLYTVAAHRPRRRPRS